MIRLLGTGLFLSILGSLQAQTCLTTTELISQHAGSSGNDMSILPRLSGDGRFVVFTSDASDLGPTNNAGVRDIYRFDRATGAMELVSCAADGTPGNDNSYIGSISDDGSLVAFDSDATNLVAGDTNNLGDVFVKNMQTGVVERVSVGTLGGQANSLSFVGYISGDGRYVTFQSGATNLLLVPDTNSALDVYVRDRQTGTTALVSTSFSGGFANGGNSLVNSISKDGRYIVFRSVATDIVGLDTNGAQDVFVRDTVLGSTSRVSIGPLIAPGLWVQGNADSSGGAVSDDGRFVAFVSLANNLVSGDTNNASDVYVRDRLTGTTTAVSQASGPGFTPANGASNSPRMSGDGAIVIYTSSASNLVSADANGAIDIFRTDLPSGTTTLVSRETNGLQGQAASINPALSRGGTWVAWESVGSFGEAVDSNATKDVFVRGLDCTFPELYCTAKKTSNGCTPSVFYGGEPQADLSGGFYIAADDVINNKPGVMFYGLSGKANVPFQLGTLCVMPPTKRGPITFSAGNPPPNDCSGSFRIDMDAYAAGLLGGGPLPQLTIAGTVVNAQWWGRDPGYAFPNDTMLSNAIEYTVRP